MRAMKYKYISLSIKKPKEGGKNDKIYKNAWARE